MTLPGLERLNGQAEAEAVEALRRCFDSEVWARFVATRRPFDDRDALLSAAQAGWREMSDGEWHAVIASFSEAPLPHGDVETRAAADVALKLYRQRFGHPFISMAEDVLADELLMLIRIRLGHEELAEHRRSRDEYRNLARRRLDRMLGTAAS